MIERLNICAVLTLLLGCTQALAHHSASAHFDLDTKLELRATVTKFVFVNPHSYIYFTVPDQQGKPVAWRCETLAKTTLMRLGWTPDVLTPGRKITIKGAPARREEHMCFINSIVDEQGKEISRHQGIAAQTNTRLDATANIKTSRPVRLSDGHPNLQGLWFEVADLDPNKPNIAVNPAGGAVQTDAGKAAAKHYDRRFDDPAFKCKPANILFAWTRDLEVNEIVMERDKIILKYGYMNMVREIHLNGQHPNKIVPSVGGHSIGKWEGDVLVVDTVGFSPGVLVPVLGWVHSNQLHIVERFQLDRTGTLLTRTFRAEDPLYLKTAHEGMDVMKTTNEPYMKYECVELSGKNNERPTNSK